MEDIEDKLKQYRLRKRRQEKVERVKEIFNRFLMFGVKDKNENERPDRTTVTIHHESDADDSLRKSLGNSSDVGDTYDSDQAVLSSEDDTVPTVGECESAAPDNLILKYTLWLVYLAFWVTLFIIAIELQFGIVFLMFSALFGIYLNTRTGPRNRHEISAYSVFNKNCESIDGTLKAEQFEREIGIRHKTSI